MRTAIVSTYPPRVCGIGTFAADVHACLQGVAGVDGVERVVIVDQQTRPERPGVLATIAQGVRGDYVRAARLLGRLDVDVVLLQHEYGIFGGRDGEYVQSLVEELSQPLVVTLHTVLEEPGRHRAAVLESLCDKAELVIVMTESAATLLEAGGACPAEKIRVVPHGAPAVLLRRAAEHRNGRRSRYAAAGPDGRRGERFLLSTFGLISAGKGIETVIDALPSIVERHPQVLYLVAGQTHPDIARREGEQYRLGLELSVLERDLGDHVEFDNRFLPIDELADLLAATDVFVTPYLNREQIASGALTFAIAAGCAVVSTPYRYAEDLLASGAGELVPFGDAGALAAAVNKFLEHPEALAAARAEAHRVGSQLAWPAVAEATAAVLREAVERAPRRRLVPVGEFRLSTIRTDHLRTLVDDAGIIQHANGAIPNRSTGYCVDDVARLAVVAVELSRRGDEQAWTSIVHRSLAFLIDATEPGVGMRNFMAYDRRWLDEPHIGDHVGRSIWAVGELLATAWAPGVVGPAQRLLDALIGTVATATSIRTDAYAALGISKLDADRVDEAGWELLGRAVERLVDGFERHADDGWRWVEDRLTYDNARLSQALIAGGGTLERPEAVAIGLETLRWLGDESGLGAGRLRLTGNLGRRRDEPAPGGGDEQPLDAAALVEAELDAFEATGEPEHRRRARLAFDWFLGRNRLRRPLYDFATGGCCDGLGAEDANGNEGAESTLAFHRAALLLDGAALPSAARSRVLETRR